MEAIHGNIIQVESSKLTDGLKDLLQEMHLRNPLCSEDEWESDSSDGSGVDDKSSAQNSEQDSISDGADTLEDADRDGQLIAASSDS